jgi:hypothetical protein
MDAELLRKFRSFETTHSSGALYKGSRAKGKWSKFLITDTLPDHDSDRNHSWVSEFLKTITLPMCLEQFRWRMCTPAMPEMVIPLP